MSIDPYKQNISVGGHVIPYILCGNEKEIWFQPSQLCEMLLYDEVPLAIRTHVNCRQRTLLRTLQSIHGERNVEMGEGSLLPIGSSDHLVNDMGVWALIYRSQLASIDDLVNFMSTHAIPMIRHHSLVATQGVEVALCKEERELALAQGRQQLAQGLMHVFGMMSSQGISSELDKLIFSDAVRTSIRPLNRIQS